MSKKSMFISDIEKASTKFKQTHKVSVSGPFDEEKPPKWFLTYMEAFRKEIDENQPTWFKKWEKEKFEPLVKRIDNLVVKNNLKEYNWINIKKVLDKYNLNESVRSEELSEEILIDIYNNLK